MTRDYLVRRYILFIFGLVVTTFGVAFVTKAMLGTSPLSAIPYSLSLITPTLSFGFWSVAISLMQIGLSVLLLKGMVNKVDLTLEIVVAFVFGYFIDISMFVLQDFNPEGYFFQLLSLLVGCVILAFGAYFSITADVVLLPNDAFLNALSKVSHREYGQLRVLTDLIQAGIGAIFCLVFLQSLVGVREGTIIGAILTGNIVKIIMRICKPLTNRILPKTENTEPKCSH